MDVEPGHFSVGCLCGRPIKNDLARTTPASRHQTTITIFFFFQLGSFFPFYPQQMTEGVLENRHRHRNIILQNDDECALLLNVIFLQKVICYT
jgi:hypothetical protein